ncbi:MAG: hypothetical protein AB7O97_03735 [Planctomycetota bacterium]
MIRISSAGRLGLASALGLSLSFLASNAVDTAAPANRFGAGAEIEAALTGGDVLAGTLQIANVNVNVAGATMALPSGRAVSLADALGAPLPGRTQPGFVGTGVGAVVSPTLLGADGVDILFDPAHNVVIGPLTQNDPGGPFEGRTISVLGLEMVPAIDPRLDPFQALVGPLPVDLASIPLGALVEVLGWPGDDGRFYVTELVSEVGTPAGGVVNLVALERARCRGGRLEARGAFSGTNGTIEILNEAGQVLGAGAVDPLDGTFNIRANAAACPGTIRARHVQSGSISEPFAVALN